MAERGIYVDGQIQADVNTVWRYTQEPQIHELWDLRFSAIRYLPRADNSQPQQFLYSTRIAFGLAIDGNGESTGTRDDAIGQRTSALRFWSQDSRSLIREGRVIGVTFRLGVVRDSLLGTTTRPASVPQANCWTAGCSAH